MSHFEIERTPPPDWNEALAEQQKLINDYLDAVGEKSGLRLALNMFFAGAFNDSLGMSGFYLRTLHIQFQILESDQIIQDMKAVVSRTKAARISKLPPNPSPAVN